MRVLEIWGLHVLLVFLLFVVTNSEFLTSAEVPFESDFVKHKYDRLDEVQKACSSVISSGVEFKLSYNEIDKVKNDLSFYNGDWEQQENSAPLLPFDDRVPSMKNTSHFKSPYKLASFRLTDVSSSHQSKKTVGVNGYLTLGISFNLLPVMANDRPGQEFSMWKGNTELFVYFQGIYAESKKNGGERLLCLLGNTMLPSRQPDSRDEDRPPLLQDDQILLVLRYPKRVSLKNRGVQGEMTSLNPKTNLKYFDKVQITSQLQFHAQDYEFNRDEIVSKACDPYPYSDSLLSSSIETYKGHDFCTMLTRVSTDASFVVAPHWRCNGTDEFCRKFGPFGFNKEINATDGGFNDMGILIQNIACLPKKTRENAVTTAQVSAVFRAFDVPDNMYIERQRSGLGNMTLFAEGIWKSSSGQLCMIACLGIMDVEGNGCDSRICLYIPLSFSITQRSTLIGTISSIEHNNPPFFPLSLEMQSVILNFMYDSYADAQPYYRYSKIPAAGAVLEKDEPFSFSTVVKKSLLTFPKLQDSEDYSESLHLLAEDLSLHVSAVPDPIPNYRSSRTDVQMEILTVGSMFGRDWFSSNSTTLNDEAPYRTKPTYTEKQLLLNVSTQLRLVTGPHRNLSEFFLEGLYDQHVGKMYMIGCRDVRASWKVLYEAMDLEDGLDCLTEVVISYPPTTARWLVNPSAKISISSQREEDNPFYFKQLQLQTLPILYRQQREEILSRRGFEGILRILTLSFAIGCILSQLLYTRNTSESLPYYMSLVMLGSQVIGYALPLIIDAKALSRSSFGEKSDRVLYDLENAQLTRVIDYTVKFLVLVCFILTLRLFHKVWKSRVKLLSQNPQGVPSDRRVLISTMVIHIIGYSIALIVHSVKTGDTPIRREQYVDTAGNPYLFQTWKTLFEEYIGLLQDLFLLPQVIGNVVWQINSKPLRKVYYMGITTVRLLPHVYDYVQGPVSNPFFSEEYEFVNQNFDFYSAFGDIVIPILAIGLAVIVYVQQRCSYEKLSDALTFGRLSLLPYPRSRMYERLPSQVVEAELVSRPMKGATSQEIED